MDFEIKRLTSIKSPQAFRERMQALGLEVPIDDAILTAPTSPLASTINIGGFKIGNRYCIHPMEARESAAPAPACRKQAGRSQIN